MSRAAASRGLCARGNPLVFRNAASAMLQGVGKPEGDPESKLDCPSEPHLLQLVVFRLDGQRYALSLPVVERVLPMAAVSPLPKAPAIALGVINLHGQILPVLDIRRRFGLPPGEYGLSAHLVVARTTRRWLALPAPERGIGRLGDAV